MIGNVTVKAYKGLVDWYAQASQVKKIYIGVAANAILILGIIRYFTNAIDNRDFVHNSRIDSITVFYTTELAKCNSEVQEKYPKLLEILTNRIQAQDKMDMEQKRLELEFEKLKNKR